MHQFLQDWYVHCFHTNPQSKKIFGVFNLVWGMYEPDGLPSEKMIYLIVWMAYV